MIVARWNLPSTEGALAAAHQALGAMPPAAGLLGFVVLRVAAAPVLIVLSQWADAASRERFLTDASQAARGKVDASVADIDRRWRERLRPLTGFGGEFDAGFGPGFGPGFDPGPGPGFDAGASAGSGAGHGADAAAGSTPPSGRIVISRQVPGAPESEAVAMARAIAALVSAEPSRWPDGLTAARVLVADPGDAIVTISRWTDAEAWRRFAGRQLGRIDDPASMPVSDAASEVHLCEVVGAVGPP